MTAASLVPLMAIVKVWSAESVPSDTVTVKFAAAGSVRALMASLSGTNVKSPFALLTKSVPKGPACDTSNASPSTTVLPAVPPLMPKVSGAPLEVLAAKVPEVAVNVSNAMVSFSVGARKAPNVGGVGAGGGRRPIMVSGTDTKLAGSGVSAFSVGWILSFWMKLIGCTGSELSEGGVLDPVDPTPFVAVESTSCWASCSSAMRAGEFWSWFTMTEEPCGRRTMVTPGSSTTMCRGTASLVTSSNAPCSRSL